MNEPHAKDMATILYWLEKQVPHNIFKDLKPVAEQFNIWSGTKLFATVQWNTIQRGKEEYHIPFFTFSCSRDLKSDWSWLRDNQTSFWINQWMHTTLEDTEATKKCQTCNKADGKFRMHNGLTCGYHCDKCFQELVDDYHKPR